ncbi:glycoside hydrolase family 28 protein [Aliifodinibius sp. S!AR15-10]|uniref:glycoside hydrolase family 28 protein n=1 Tax=Aliifodinibius sp. S!AR15-10 TaxID=2950437 RepID=UPI0028563570|nr:glycoside hydrolase family 28 protein [Aliifodinibius sp. S!AR15-10]MDR8391937.1 glycoside hydrolase family 28 protein [Aliifodinibius sp. S!AR15-10]
MNTLMFKDKKETKVMKICRAILLLMVTTVVTITANAQNKEVPQEIAPIDAPFEVAELERPSFPDRTFDIRDYGAQPMSDDSTFKNTDAIHRAIEAAHQAGGGRVLIPEGEWLTGPIHMMSNINLHIAKGAVLEFSTDKQDYLPVVRQRHEGVEAYNYSPMIYAFKLKNVAVTGKGTLDGQGDHWWAWADEHNHSYGERTEATKVPLSRREYGKGAGLEGMRPNFMIFWKSENILVEGITLKDSPMWNVHLVYSNKAIVRDVTVNSLRAPNGDGVVLDSASDVLVEYNHFQTGDDAVVLKSGVNEEALKIDMPTQNIVVRNFEARNVRTGSGGIVFGSETSGGIRNVYVHDAYFEGTDRGIRFKTERGRGNVIENIYVRDIRMKDIDSQAINFNTYYSGPGITGPAPLIRNIDIRNIHIDGVPEPIVLVGLPEKWLENILLQDVTVVNAKEGALVTRVKNLTMRNVEISSENRAMEVNDSYELTLDNVTLTDNAEGPPMLLKGEYTGAIFTDDFPLNRIEFGDQVSKEMVSEKPEQQVW